MGTFARVLARKVRSSPTRLKQEAFHVFHAGIVGGCLVISIFVLLRAYKHLRRSRKIVIFDEGGFGHTITGPEAARRLFKGQNPAMVILSERTVHNPLVSKLWPDIKVVFLPLVVRLRIFGHSVFLGGGKGGATVSFRRSLRKVIARVLSRVVGAEILTLQQLYGTLAATHPTLAASYSTTPDMHWYEGLRNLIETVDVPPPRLPETMRNAITQRIRRSMGLGESSADPLYCCLSLRSKGAGKDGKDGSPLAAYDFAVARLIDRGYTVLLTGDKKLDSAQEGKLQRKLVSAEVLGIDPWQFSLFANTEAKIWMGDGGGPPCIPMCRNIPYLSVNLFPYGFCLPNAYIFYKTVRDREGRLIPYERLFEQHAYDSKLDGWTVCDNTADEILAAVDSFLAELSQPSGSPRAAMVMHSLPDHVVAKQVNGRLLPAWLDLFDREKTASKTASPARRPGDEKLAHGSP